MTLLIFFVGLAIWLALDRQAVRHRIETEIECAERGSSPPTKQPGLPILEAWLNIVLGAILVGYSVLSLVVLFLTPAETGKFVVVLFATGLVMMGVGGRQIAKRG